MKTKYSFGLGICKYADDGCPSILICKKRVSYEFLDFVRGLYPTDDDYTHLKILINRMNKIERDLIASMDFTKIWSHAYRESLVSSHAINCENKFYSTYSIDDNKKKLKTFFNRKYDYDICFLSASKYHKREDYDDLLILSKQICTTSSGYLINYKNVEKIYNIVKEGNELLKVTGDSNSYCIDRYWCKLCNDNKVFIFKNKLGFQKPSQSKITGAYNCNLD